MNNKGFAHVMLMMILVALILGGGVIYFLGGKYNPITTISSTGNAVIYRVATYDVISSSLLSGVTKAYFDSSEFYLSNPAKTYSLSTGAHVFKVSSLPGYRLHAYATSYPISGQRFRSYAWPITPTCSNGYCQFSAGVSAGYVTEVSYRYEAPPTDQISIKNQIVTNGNLYVFSSSAATVKTGTQVKGTKGIVIGGPTLQNGINVWQVDFASGADGWVLERASAGRLILNRVLVATNSCVRTYKSQAYVGCASYGLQGTLNSAAGTINTSVNFDNGTYGNPNQADIALIRK